MMMSGSKERRLGIATKRRTIAAGLLAGMLAANLAGAVPARADHDPTLVCPIGPYMFSCGADPIYWTQHSVEGMVEALPEPSPEPTPETSPEPTPEPTKPGNGPKKK